ncbi:15-cis-phytoene desaturase [Aureliella helgolandensis]|uniref:15-cis-phytoene desaturase n=2 Tax=Aureliella helgolandensis TaxID=2527968 RepID=A0A518GGZ9_9BACT|nr:15-cis-phytoene desaturase [Aureliella helgolandensis]
MRLAQPGQRVTLLESRRQLGGRAGSFLPQAARSPSTSIEATSIDYCQHVGMGCCSNLLHLIDLLGQQADWKRERQLHFYSSAGAYRRLSALPFSPAPLHLSGWLWRWPDLSLLDRYRIASGMLKLKRLELTAELDAHSALEWLQAARQTPRGISNFWTTILVSALGEQLSNVSLHAMCKVLQDGFLNHCDAYHLLIPQRPLSELFGSEMQKHLEQSGVEVQLSSPAVAIQTTSLGRMKVVTSSAEFTADSIVVAVPWHHIANLAVNSSVPELSQLASHTAQLRASAIAGVHTWWDRAWLPTAHAAIVGRTCQWVFPRPTTPLPAASSTTTISAAAEIAASEHYYQIVISASHRLRGKTSDDIAELICEEIRALFPRARPARLLGLKAVNDPHAVFSIRPGSLQHRPSTRLTPTIALAGDWTNTGWPATMEGAILSGFRAAAEIAANRSP